MTCQNCNNKTDGRCCHEAIRDRTELTGDEISIGRELRHFELMQSQKQKDKSSNKA